MAVVKLTNLSRLFRHFADMIDNGYCDNITEDDIDAMTEVLKPYLNVKVNYEQAKKITGKTDSAFNSKISRCGLKPTKERLYRYIDMLKIKHNIGSYQVYPPPPRVGIFIFEEFAMLF